MLDPTPSSTLEEAPERAPLSGITSGQSTHPGHLRDKNEDYYGSAPDLGFFVVADGVGGAPAGAMAARLATAAMLRSLRSGSTEPDLADNAFQEPRGSLETHGPRLVAAALTAHQMICKYAAQNGCHGAATTMAALWVAKDHVHVANTGDSRVYRLTDSGLEQLTRDHTAIREYMDLYGPPTERWARLMENIVTQVLGGKSGRVPAVHLASLPLKEREVFLLCTDGLTKMVSDADIALVLRKATSAQQAADVLVELANDWGGVDNTTCIVVYAEP